MTDIRIQLGAAPWQPDPESELIETFSYYDRPLVGVIRSGDSSVLFECLSGHVDDRSVWGYVSIDDDELEMLRDTEDLHTAIHSITDARLDVIAISDSDRIVRYKTPMSPQSVESDSEQMAIGAKHYSIGILVSGFDVTRAATAATTEIFKGTSALADAPINWLDRIAWDSDETIWSEIPVAT